MFDTATETPSQGLKERTCRHCQGRFKSARRNWLCPECSRKYLAEHREKNREWHAAYSRKYRARLGDEYRARMIKRRKDLIAAMTPDELADHRKKDSEKSMRIYLRVRDEVFAAYGGTRCACCGETEARFLSIDHVNNDGAERRRRGEHGAGGTGFYQWLRKNGFPPGFQVLCMNCNFGKYRNGGTCPHQTRCND